MAEISYPFATSEITTEDQWSRMQRQHQLDGVWAVDPSGSDLRVSGSNASTLTVAVGEASVNGFYYRLDATLNVSVPTNSGGGSARKDLVVLRCDPSGDVVSIKYVTGSTSFPALSTNRSGVFEIPLAQVTVAAGASVVPSTGVVDARYFLGRQVALSNAASRRPSVKGQLIVENQDVFLGNGTGWDLLATAGQDTGWKPITLAAGIAIQSAPPAYRVLNGLVYLRGNFKKTSGTFASGSVATLATLPAEARPGYTRYGIVATELNVVDYGRLQMEPAGALRIVIPTGTSPAWLGIDGFTYSL